MRLTKGILVVFEGIDGSGKSTQAKLLLDHLLRRGYAAVYYCEPSDSPWGQEIKRKAAFADSLSPQEEYNLFLKDRRENVKNNLKPALRARKVVVLDRYYFSTIAYQGAKGINPDMIREANEKIAVPPDLVFIMDIDANKGLKRIEDRKKLDNLFERKEYLVKVREIFKSFKGENIFHFNALNPVDEIQKEIAKIVFDYLKSKQFSLM